MDTISIQSYGPNNADLEGSYSRMLKGVELQRRVLELKEMVQRELELTMQIYLEISSLNLELRIRQEEIEFERVKKAYEKELAKLKAEELAKKSDENLMNQLGSLEGQLKGATEMKAKAKETILQILEGNYNEEEELEEEKEEKTGSKPIEGGNRKPNPSKVPVWLKLMRQNAPLGGTLKRNIKSSQNEPSELSFRTKLFLFE